MNFTIKYLHNALNQKKPMKDLKFIIQGLLEKGYKRDYILEEFENFRKKSDDEIYEDVVLDVMDCLTGWCSHQIYIKEPFKNIMENKEIKMAVNL